MSEADRDLITIVSGLPRSGTSMMMRMLDKGGLPALTDEIREADEDNPRGYYEFEPVKKTKEDPSWLDQARGKVVKMVHVLLLDLPLDRRYRVIFTRRHLDEVIRSQNVMLDRKGKKGGEIGEHKLKAVFTAQLQQVGKYLEAHRDNFDVLNVDYNEILVDPRPTVESMNEFLGGRMDTRAMIEVVEPDLYRKRAASNRQ